MIMTKYNKKIKNIYLMINKKKTSGKMTDSREKNYSFGGTEARTEVVERGGGYIIVPV